MKPNAAKEKPQRSAWLAAVAALMAAALAAASGNCAYGQAAPMPPPVTVSEPLKTEIVEWEEFSGQFAAVDFIEVRARVSGYLTEIHFQDGQIVKKGDLLFVIDPRPYEATLAAAQAQLSQASAQVDLAQRQLDRSAELRKKDFEAASSYDERLSQFKVATAQVESAKAAIRLAQLNVEFTHIAAPVTGRISQHLVSIGNLVNGGEGSGSTLLTTIVSLDPIYFNFDMNEADYLAYQRTAAKGIMKSTRDQTVPVELHLIDEHGWPHTGTLNFVDNRIDRSSGTIRVRAEFPNADFFLTAGAFGRIRIPGSEPYQAILVPDSAVITDQSRKVVFTVKDDGTVVPKVIRPGPIYDNLRIVRSGLDPADRIIIDGLVRARPGAKVTPQPGKITLVPDSN